MKQNYIILVIAVTTILMVWWFMDDDEDKVSGESSWYDLGTIVPMTTSGATIVYGCTDPNAQNYSSVATHEDNSCFFHAGCCDVSATNYDAQADSCNWVGADGTTNNALLCNYS